MRQIVWMAAALLAAAIGVAPAGAEIMAQVSLSQQTMTVIVDGVDTYVWPVSTARRGFVTPKGKWGAQSMHRMHSLFNNAPMPFTIFYNGHYAIHGTTDVKKSSAARRPPAAFGCIPTTPASCSIW